MSSKKHEDKTWREFEKEVEQDVQDCVSSDKYRVVNQRSSTYKDGETKRMDIHVAEKRQGGNHHVIDAKHFHGDLPASEIVDTKDYQTRARASSATVVISDTTTIPDNTQDKADELGVDIVRKRGPGITNRVKEVFDKQPDYYFDD
jgi:hypothetical protein